MPPREPVPAQPEAPPAPSAEPLPVKVGLASDLDSVSFPCCEEELDVAVDTQAVPATTTLKIEPAAATAQQGYYRLQVAALRDERQAQDLAKELERVSGQPGEAFFDAGIDLYRVRIGRYPTREAAEADARRLGAVGVTGAFVVNEGAAVSAPAFRITQGQSSQVYAGRWLSVAPVSGPSVRVRKKRYRGRMLVYLNDRGSLNLINELPVEDYLRGVVPSEMGPELYNQLEALKAQAVAARTYTLRNMGEFAREGYDICATPRCQVYGGMQIEHPLSDQAIAETAGQVLLYRGELVNALYSSTCGGHTEDVHVIFPLQREPYLKAVPCMEAGIARIPGELTGGTFPAGFTRRLLPAASGSSPVESLGARLEHLALLAGLPASRERLGGLDRREVQRYIASVFDLALDARLFLAPEDVNYLLSNPPPDWSQEDRRRAAYLIRSGLVSGPLDQPLSEGEVERMLLALAELLRVVRREDVSFLSVANGKLTVRSGKMDKIYDLPPGLAHLPPAGGRPLQLRAGDGARGSPDPLLAGGPPRRRHPGDRSRRHRLRPQQPLQLVDPLPHRLADRDPGEHPLPGPRVPEFRDPHAGRVGAGGEDPDLRRQQDDGRRRPRRALDARRAGHSLHRQAPGPQGRGARLAVHRPRFRPRGRDVPGGSLRHGPAGSHLPRDPHPLLHRSRAGEGALEAARRRWDEVNLARHHLAQYVDHTLLRPEATEAEVRRLVAEAAEHGFASVCIPPVYVPLAAEILRGTAVAVGTVVGFPLGYVHPEIRRAESRQAVADGAGELDTVLNISWLKSGEDQRVLADLAGWVEAMRREREGLILKVILETALLTDEEKVRGARLVVQSGADFVKTSTGFSKGGATVEDVALLAKTVEGRIGVKASGGIRDAATARAMIAAGATAAGDFERGGDCGGGACPGGRWLRRSPALRILTLGPSPRSGEGGPADEAITLSEEPSLSPRERDRG